MPNIVLDPIPLYNNTTIGATYTKLENTNNQATSAIVKQRIQNQLLQRVIGEFLDAAKLECAVFVPYSELSRIQTADILRITVDNERKIFPDSFGVCAYVNGKLKGHIIGVIINDEIIIYMFQVHDTSNASIIAHCLLLIFKYHFCFHPITICVSSNSYDASDILEMNQFQLSKQRKMFRAWDVYQIQATVITKLTIPFVQEIKSNRLSLIVK
jgi:hypothetical protein